MYDIEAILHIELEVQSLRIVIDKRLELLELVVNWLEWLGDLNNVKWTSMQLYMDAMELQHLVYWYLFILWLGLYVVDELYNNSLFTIEKLRR